MKKFFTGGAICLLVVWLGGGILFYDKKNREGVGTNFLKIQNKQDKSFAGFSYVDFLKDGYISLSSEKVRKILNVLNFNMVNIKLKNSSFSLEGKARLGFMKGNSLWLKNFKGKVCDNLDLKAKEISILVENSKVENIKLKDFVIKSNHFLFFSKRKKKIDTKNFCSELSKLVKERIP